MAPNLDFLALGAALAAAFAASPHCAVMCGPLRLLCGSGPRSRWKYQAGRGLAYGLLGAAAGGVGFVLPWWALLVLVAAGLLGSWLNLPLPAAWGTMRRKLLLAGSAHPFLLGLASGLLPCGLLHGWIAAAAATAHPLRGAALLFVLWAGTLPALELASSILRTPLAKLSSKYPRALRTALLCLALLPLAQRMPPRPEKVNAPAVGAPAQCPYHASP